MATLTPRFAGGSTTSVEVRGGSIAVETLGKGDSVLLVHGFPHTRVVWREVAAGLVRLGEGAVHAVGILSLLHHSAPTRPY